MNVVKTKYSSIAPRLSYLRDTVILAQAWKKAHTYIRRHNRSEERRVGKEC